MTVFGPEDDLSGARFVGTDLSGAVLRAVELRHAEIDSPWLIEDGNTLLVNGVDVLPFVEAELDRSFPGRAERHAADPAGLRSAWASVEAAWASAVDRAAALPDGSVEIAVADEWSFAQTLRHLVMATDTWLRKAILELDAPYHPLGVANAEYATDGHDPAVFSTDAPSYAQVLHVRAQRVAMVRDYLASVTPAGLDGVRRNPWASDRSETVRSCLHVILHEEWEHLRYALRDLDAIESRLGA